MFDSRHTSIESNDTIFNPDSARDADLGFTAPLPDAGALTVGYGGCSVAFAPGLTGRGRNARPTRSGRLSAPGHIAGADG